MRRKVELPPDWKVRVQAGFQKYSPPTQKQMSLWLQSEEVNLAAESLWNAARKRPAVRKEFHVLIEDVLYELTLALRRRPWRRRTAAGWRNIAKALEEVHEDNLCFRDNGPAREELPRAADKYRQMATGASRTKPRDMQRRQALGDLRSIFNADLANFCDDAVAYFMTAAFGGVWTVEIVRTRASEWGLI